MSNSADSNLYILTNLPDGAQKSIQLTLYVSVFVPYNVFFSWPMEHLLMFLYEGHVIHKSTLIFGVRVNNFVNIPFVFVNGNDVVYNVSVSTNISLSVTISVEFSVTVSFGWLFLSVDVISLTTNKNGI